MNFDHGPVGVRSSGTPSGVVLLGSTVAGRGQAPHGDDHAHVHAPCDLDLIIEHLPVSAGTNAIPPHARLNLCWRISANRAIEHSSNRTTLNRTTSSRCHQPGQIHGPDTAPGPENKTAHEQAKRRSIAALSRAAEFAHCDAMKLHPATVRLRNREVV